MQTCEMKRLMIASWAVFGVGALLAESGVRLLRFSLPILRAGLTPSEWIALAVTAIALGYVEGYRGFTRSFAPRVVSRAFDMNGTVDTSRVALAPLYAMSLLGDTRPRVVRAWALVFAIVAMVVAVRHLPETWRGIVDASVACSMTWGVLVLAALWVARLRRELALAAAR